MSITATVPLGAWIATPKTGNLPPDNTGFEQAAGWLLDLVETGAQQMLIRIWNPTQLALLNSGIVPADNSVPPRKLASKAAEKASQLGWKAIKTSELAVCSRTERLIQAVAVAKMQQTSRIQHIHTAVQGWLQTNLEQETLLLTTIKAHKGAGKVRLPKDLVQAATDRVKATAPLGTHKGEVTAALRELGSYKQTRNQWPDSVFEYRSYGAIAAVIELGVASVNMAKILSVTPDETTGQLIYTWEVKLPARADPHHKLHWSRWVVSCTVPEHVARIHTDIVKWCLPQLRRNNDGKLLLSASLEANTPQLPPYPTAIETTTVLGVDYSPYNFCAATPVASTGDENLWTRGVGFFYDSGGMLEKYLRLQDHADELQAKIDRVLTLAANQPSQGCKQKLEDKATALTAEKHQINARRKGLRRELAFDAANWVIGLAKQTGATAVTTEDLAKLPANGVPKHIRRALSLVPRGEFYEALKHQGAKAGIWVQQVVAAGSSKYCPSCKKELQRPSYELGGCEPCEIKAHRDTLAAQNLGARGFEPALPDATTSKGTGRNPRVHKQGGKHLVAKNRVPKVKKTRTKTPIPQLSPNEYNKAHRSNRPPVRAKGINPPAGTPARWGRMRKPAPMAPGGKKYNSLFVPDLFRVDSDIVVAPALVGLADGDIDGVSSGSPDGLNQTQHH